LTVARDDERFMVFANAIHGAGQVGASRRIRDGIHDQALPYWYVKLYNHAVVHVEREAVRPSCRKDGDVAEAKTKAAPC
jgi:hypothetical protein